VIKIFKVTLEYTEMSTFSARPIYKIKYRFVLTEEWAWPP